MTDMLRDLRPNQYLLPAFLPEYELKSHLIYNELVTTDCLLTYLEKIAAFAKHLDFVDREKMIFLTIAYVSFYQAAVLRLWKVLDGPIDHFRARVREGVLPEHLHEYDSSLGEAREAQRSVAHIVKRLKKHRNNSIAHLDLASVGSLVLPALPIPDLRRLFSATKDAFERISPGTKSITLPLEYYDTNPDEWTIRDDTDLDQLLLFLLKNSAAVREPEHLGDTWRSLRSHYPPDELARLNFCRSLCGLPPA